MSSPAVGQVSGWYWEAAPPKRLSVVRSEGSCAYYASQVFCREVCAANELCTEGGVCERLPTAIDVGPLHIAGTSSETTMQARDNGEYVTEENVPDLVQPGAIVTLAGGGDGSAAAPFSVSTRGVPVLTGSWQDLRVGAGADLELSWDLAVAAEAPLLDAADPAANVSEATVIVHLDSDHHGVPAFVECTAPDSDGRLTVPAAILEPLFALPTSNGSAIENAWIARRRRGTAVTDRGCASLVAEWFENIRVCATPRGDGGCRE